MLKKLPVTTFLFFLLLFSEFGCQPTDPVQPDPSVITPTPAIEDIYACKLIGSTSNYVSTYANGTPAGSGSQYSTTIFKDTTFTRNSQYTFVKITYDKDGFLIKKLQINSNLYNGDSSISESNYTYANGKLLEHNSSQKTKSSGIVLGDRISNSSEKYFYDSKGLVEKYISATSGFGQTVVRTFVDGVNKTYQTTNSQGVVSDMSKYINGQGFITQATSTPDIPFFTRFTYDTNGNVLRNEEWQAGQLTSYTEYEIGRKSNQKKSAFFEKGHPVLPPLFGSYHNLVTKSSYYQKLFNANKFVKRSESVFAYQFNANDLITNTKTTTQYFDALGELYSTTVDEKTNSYMNCN